MATFDYRKSKVSIQHGNKYDCIPHVEIDPPTFSYGKTYWLGSGTVEDQKAGFKYIGLSMDSDKFKIDKARISIKGWGSSVFSRLNWSYKDFDTLTEAEPLKKISKQMIAFLQAGKMTLFAERLEATKSMVTVGMTSWLAVVAMIASMVAQLKIYRLVALVKTIFHAREGVIPSEW